MAVIKDPDTYGYVQNANSVYTTSTVTTPTISSGSNDLTFTTIDTSNSLVFNGNDLVYQSGDGWNDTYVRESDMEKVTDRLERIENALMIPPELKEDPERLEMHAKLKELYDQYQDMSEKLKTWERLAGDRDD